MTHDKLITYYANQRTRKLRELLRRDYGARCYRITQNDEIYVYGIATGWRLLGSRRDVESNYLF